MENEKGRSMQMLDIEASKELARIHASSTLVPQQYQGEKGRANCLIALEIAQRLSASPLMVMQNLHIIQGRPSWSASFLIAAINQSKRFASPLRYEEMLDASNKLEGMRAYAADHEGEVVTGPWVTIEMAKAEGWFSRNGSKWKTMPELMLRYRAAAFFARTVCPDLTMGLPSVEESRDIIDIGPENYKKSASSSTEHLAEVLFNNEEEDIKNVEQETSNE